MSALESPVVGLKQDLNLLSDDYGDIDFSVDGGETWTNVVHQEDDLRGPREDVYTMAGAAGQNDVKVRFHFGNADWDWWWQVDDVFIGNRSCDPSIDGGYVVGTVSGSDSDEGVVGATVTSVDAPEDTATTVATPDDENLDDGFYWLFSTLAGTHDFEATARNFETQTRAVDVAADDAVRADFALGSGFVEVSPASINTSVTLGSEATTKLTISNTGSGAAEVQLSEVAGDFEIMRADGTKQLMSEMHEVEGAPCSALRPRSPSLSRDPAPPHRLTPPHVG